MSNDSKQTFTPGPYRAVHNNYYWEIQSDLHGQIANTCPSNTIYIDGLRVPDSQSTEIAEANAHLFAAAHEMYDALKDIIGRNEIQHWFNLDQARAAIHKADGESA